VEAGETEGRYRYTLVVGPDSPDRAWLESVLMRGGLEVAACSEDELLAMPDIVPPQIVVLDDSSRREQRMASFANLRAHAALVGTPIVILAYDADIESFSGAITRGAAAYFAKPVPPEDVVAAVHKITGWLGSVDRTERRRRLRRPLLMRVDVAVDGRDGVVAGQMVDVGAQGCRVEMPWAVEVGDVVHVTLYGLEGSTDLTLHGDVRWRRPVPGGSHVAGVRFTGTSAVLGSRLLGPLTARS
jgi:ActR/RegA family two-component response regulator